MTATIATGPSRWAQLLGYGGLIPFVVLAAATWLAPPDWRSYIGLALLGYGATITSFIGAIHWGLVMRDESLPSRPSPLVLAWGVVPSLIAWFALMLGLISGPTAGLCVIAALLWLCFAVDRIAYPRFNAQAWLPMRLLLTLVASASCIAGAWGMLR